MTFCVADFVQCMGIGIFLAGTVFYSCACYLVIIKAFKQS